MRHEVMIERHGAHFVDEVQPRRLGDIDEPGRARELRRRRSGCRPIASSAQHRERGEDATYVARLPHCSHHYLQGDRKNNQGLLALVALTCLFAHADQQPLGTFVTGIEAYGILKVACCLDHFPLLDQYFRQAPIGRGIVRLVPDS